MHSFQRTSRIGNFLSKLQYYGVVFLMIPGIFIFQITVVYPNLVEMLQVGVIKQLVHLCLITFCFVNVVGNMIFSMIMDSNLKKPVYGEGTYCEYCRMARPAKSWHCMRCNACILKRDHHCAFLSRCIGLNNQRYFILFLGHILLSMIYATYYNYYFVTMKFENDGWLLSAFRILNPMIRFVIPEPMGVKDLYVFYLFLNMGLIVWSGSLFFYHTRNIVMGVSSYESKFPELMDSSKWKDNMLRVFGTRWYLAIVWPMCESPLPDDDKDP
ncbi:probable palmitoyltransferase ZDHHC24 [Helicoverpa armigera]|uniref:probable palmitoyltransferase ZDHHC24 n=1 Tax=Helicoverpa armigera TaxID=29058 RepID=UPI003082EC4C